MAKKVAKKLSSYDHLTIEKKWQKTWATKKVYKITEDKKKLKHYVLSMFPYPSGAGLHVGHPRSYIASDVYARFMRLKGFNVLHPMGYDAFGLPAEQYAIQHKIHPEKAVAENVKTFKSQLEKIGFSYDWDRVINTTDPKYYKWTQWIFLKLYNSWYNKTKDKAQSIDELVKIFEKGGNEKVSAVTDIAVPEFSAKEWKSFNEFEKEKVLMKYRLAYEGYSEVNWCPELGTVLANDEIIEKDGKQVSERGEYPVVKKSLRQWFLRITAYADKLIDGLDTLDWPNHIKEIQKNWIGKSEGSEIEFAIVGRQEKIKVFTTRADTLFGVTYVVLAPESSLVQRLLGATMNKKEVEEYIHAVKNKTQEERTHATKEKTGMELRGIKAINPANGEQVPVWVADYVLASYGTGMVMAVPAHDERDFAFAKKYNLPIKETIVPNIVDKRNPPVAGKQVVARKNVHPIVRDPKTGKYLALKWKKFDWTTFPMGGIEDGEDVVTAARREVKEETGFFNLKLVEVISGQVRAEYFAAHKNQNRVSYTTAVVFDLIDDASVDIDAKEKEAHDVIWLDESKLSYEHMTHAEIEIWKARLHKKDFVFTDDGMLINSEGFNDLSSEAAREKITKAVGGTIVTKYKMRDAVFARQRYWGEPIPLRHNTDGTITALKDKNLPLKLPKVKSYQPIGTGESPLAGVKTWVKAGYETNTMPGWAGSSWYYLRYMDPKNNSRFVGEKALKYWKQVDMYIGGAEHATGHLLYSRFWNKFLYDLGLVVTSEPFKTLKNQGMVIGSDHRKMSKRWGNVVNPDEVIKNVGADTLRIYESFMGPFEQEIPWSTDSMVGSRRFIERVWKLQEKVVAKYSDSEEVILLLNQTIKKVEEDIQSFSANTAISSMMILSNLLEQQEKISEKTYLSLIKILSPFAPHVTQEIWANLGNKKMLVTDVWPKFDAKKLVSSNIKIIVQINGRVRGTVMLPVDSLQDAVEKVAFADQNIVKWLEGKKIMKTVFIKNKIINFVA
jgi:leucyl-tRNA synthetase